MYYWTAGQFPAHRHDVCAASNRPDETRNFRSDCCLWLFQGPRKLDATRRYRNTSICWYRGPVWGLTAVI